jgi:peptide/nickel transport system permease protein
VTALLVRRVVGLIPLLLVVSFVAFIVLQFSPGDPARLMLGENATDEGIHQLRTELGLDRPLWIQYATFVLNGARGDLGRSYATSQPVVQELGARVAATAELSAVSFLLSIAVGIPLGITAAVWRNSLLDHVLRVLVLTFVSVPVFWLGILLIYLFAVTLHWLPSTGSSTPAHLVLPAIALATYTLGVLVRMTRAAMLDVLKQDFLRTAYAKGLRLQSVIVRHALKNAMIPIITIMGLQLGSLLSGAVLTETVFAWPGVGKFMIDALFARDYPVIRACILLFSVIFLLANLIVDVLYVYLDPRVRYA